MVHAALHFSPQAKYTGSHFSSVQKTSSAKRTLLRSHVKVHIYLMVDLEASDQLLYICHKETVRWAKRSFLQGQESRGGLYAGCIFVSNCQAHGPHFVEVTGTKSKFVPMSPCNKMSIVTGWELCAKNRFRFCSWFQYDKSREWVTASV